MSDASNWLIELAEKTVDLMLCNRHDVDDARADSIRDPSQALSEAYEIGRKHENEAVTEMLFECVESARKLGSELRDSQDFESARHCVNEARIYAGFARAISADEVSRYRHINNQV